MAVSDATLVRGVLNGDKSAFAELYDRRARLIRAICLAETREPHAADDLSQEVLLRAYARLEQLSDPGKFAHWLVGIARQVCREFHRGRHRERRRLIMRSELERVGERCAPDADGPADEASDPLAEAVACLPEKQRLAVYAFYLQELDVDQARATLGLSRSGLYRVLSCARARLRRMLSRAEVVQ